MSRDSRGRVLRPRTWRVDVVRAIECFQTGLWDADCPQLADETLIKQGYPPKMAGRCLEDAADEGLIEYGVSARTGWLTDKGRALLENPESPA